MPEMRQGPTQKKDNKLEQRKGSSLLVTQSTFEENNIKIVVRVDDEREFTYASAPDGTGVTLVRIEDDSHGRGARGSYKEQGDRAIKLANEVLSKRGFPLMKLSE
ncbi:MAG TPA: hypothetical protein VMH91_00280 [Candidatus Paceibacterota bacterium]|nr:hypothetical protein [Candidatus Paceibacterota bacterium]